MRLQTHVASAAGSGPAHASPCSRLKEISAPPRPSMYTSGLLPLLLRTMQNLPFAARAAGANASNVWQSFFSLRLYLLPSPTSRATPRAMISRGAANTPQKWTVYPCSISPCMFFTSLSGSVPVSDISKSFLACVAICTIFFFEETATPLTAGHALNHIPSLRLPFSTSALYWPWRSRNAALSAKTASSTFMSNLHAFVLSTVVLPPPDGATTNSARGRSRTGASRGPAIRVSSMASLSSSSVRSRIAWRHASSPSREASSSGSEHTGTGSDWGTLAACKSEG
mmetsp:Transcript_124232/g.337401  ORF Transcript_124232/g.337401 Transcript_124232/m.337401 type:complete len:283 (+) Transcript_124232:47-895(+)